jgi:hypothetical protein
VQACFPHMTLSMSNSGIYLDPKKRNSKRTRSLKVSILNCLLHFFFFPPIVLGFELRVSHVLSRCCTTWATSQPIFFLTFRIVCGLLVHLGCKHSKQLLYLKNLISGISNLISHLIYGLF